MDNIFTAIFIGVFLVGIISLWALKNKAKKGFNFRVLTALVAGLALGFIIQIISSSLELTSSVSNLQTFTQIFSGIYVNLLQLIVIPLIFVSISMAIIEAPVGSKLGSSVVRILSVLMITVAIAAIIGYLSVNIFNLDGAKIVDAGTTSTEYGSRLEAIEQNSALLSGMNYKDLILAPISNNFSFLIGEGSTAALSTVLFGGFLGYAVLQIRKRKPEKPKAFIEFLASLKEVVLSMVREILKLTPYAVFSLMTAFMATSPLSGLGELIKFLLATYVAIFVMFLIHLVIVAIFGISPIKYIKKAWPVLVFGFGSRSSLAAMPLNIESQVEEFGVDEATANLSATFGATIGQNGCAGIYPAMLATMGAVIVGRDINFTFLLALIVVIMISSFGIAGVGGGATFAAIAVLSIMGLPIALAAVLIAVEPLLDMARTMLNISDSMVAGIVTSKSSGTLNEKVLNS